MTCAPLADARARSTGAWLGWQCLLAVAGLLGLAFAPPATGAMLIIPLDGRAAGAINLALAAQAHILGVGRLPGSVVVSGHRDQLWRSTLRAGMLLTAASPMLCATSAIRRRDDAA